MSREAPLMPDDGRVIVGVRRGGAADYGEMIQFELTFQDGRAEPFRVPYGILPAIMNGLRVAGSVAEQVRRGLSRMGLDTANPYRVTQTRVEQVTEGTIVIEFLTADGIPVQVTVPRLQAENLLKVMTEELAKASPR